MCCVTFFPRGKKVTKERRARYDTSCIMRRATAADIHVGRNCNHVAPSLLKRAVSCKIFLLVLMILLSSAQVHAAKIDAYQKILDGGRYTIRYENFTPADRVTNRNVVALYGKNGLAVETNDFFRNRPLSGVIVGDGENRYEEVGYKDFFQCRLVTGGENFIFTKYAGKRGGFEYFGDKKGKVTANPRNYLVEMLSGVTFGDVNFTEMMTAIVSDAKKTSAQKKYKLMASGTTPDGLTYEDFAARDGAIVSAIRYLFDGDKLTKISFASYGRNEFGELKARRCIVKIVEFSASPDGNLLRLPAGLVDVTKR